jgi:hypothetical protein
MPVNASTKVKEKKKKKKREKNDGYAPADSVESVTMGQHYPLVVVDESVKFAGPASTSVSYERTNEQKKKAAARQDSGKKPDQGVAIKKVSVGSYIKMYSEGQNKKKFKYAVYAMEVQNAKGKTWQIHKRFSELHGFHSRLMSREVNKNDCDWGGFPEKKWNFCSLTDHSSVKFLDERKASLNKWLTQVFRSRKITYVHMCAACACMRMCMHYSHVHLCCL